MSERDLVTQFRDPSRRNAAMAQLSGFRGAKAARGQVLSPEKRAALISGLSDPNAAVRRCCLELLDTHPDPAAVPAILVLVRDPVARVRWHAIHALACDACKPGNSFLSQETLAAISDAASSDPSRRVRAYAQQVLVAARAA